MWVFWGMWVLGRVNKTVWHYTPCIYKGEQREREKQRATILLSACYIQFIVIIHLYKFLLNPYDNTGRVVCIIIFILNQGSEM